MRGSFLLVLTKESSAGVDIALSMDTNGDYGTPVDVYVGENVSNIIVKLIQSYTGVIDKMVWRK